MKQKLLLSLAITTFFCSSIKAQVPALKIYAYSQATNGGMKPSEIAGENGEKINVGVRPGVNYLLYFSYSGSASVTITGVWINQKAYNVKPEWIKNTPIEIAENNADENSKKITLVPGTKNKVLQLTLKSAIEKPGILTGSKKKAVSESELVVSYTVNGKKYFKAVKKITVLKPAFAS